MATDGSSQVLFRDDAYLRTCRATVLEINERGGIVLDRTVFYPTGGGQPGDSGSLTWEGGDCAIATAVKGAAPGDIVHVAPDDGVPPAPGTMVEATLDWPRRYRLMRMHTCLHLLCSLVPFAVTGGQVGPEKSRLDFDIQDATLDKQAIGDGLNRLVAANLAVDERWITDAELAAQPELVRTMSVQPPSGAGTVRLIDIAGADLQPCGGTHVRRTGEIGAVEMGKIESKGRQNRRINIRLISE